MKDRQNFARVYEHDPELIRLLFSAARAGTEIAALVLDQLATSQTPDDASIFAKIQQRFYPNTPSFPAADYTAYQYGRAGTRAKQLLAMLEQVSGRTCRNYLDLGSGRNIIAEVVGKALGLTTPDIHAVDIETYFAETERVGKCSFQYFDGRSLPFPEESIDVITCLQVLHHVSDEDLDELLASMYRVLSPGGVLLLREHDICEPVGEAIVELQHAFIMVVIEKQFSFETFTENYWSHLRSRADWRGLLTRTGFRHVNVDAPEFGQLNTARFYHEIFVKPE